jgi:hypothetical protein
MRSSYRTENTLCFHSRLPPTVTRHTLPRLLFTMTSDFTILLATCRHKQSVTDSLLCATCSLLPIKQLRMCEGFVMELWRCVVAGLPARCHCAFGRYGDWTFYTGYLGFPPTTTKRWDGFYVAACFSRDPRDLSASKLSCVAVKAPKIYFFKLYIYYKL